ncbi:MAG TPA: hypothetical protein HA272_02495 [Methanoregula sp.]|nr:hypothetical protein [Methanoregula sp.]
MKHTVLCVLLIILMASAGCTSYFSNLQTPQKTLDLKETAIFSQEKTKFAATVNSVTINQKSSFPRQFTLKMTVKNTGTEAFSLIGYPRLVGADGSESAGNNIMFGSVHPNGYATGTSTITIMTEQEYAALEENAVLRVKYQSMKPLPYEGIWAVDFSSL